MIKDLARRLFIRPEWGWLGEYRLFRRLHGGHWDQIIRSAWSWARYSFE